MGWHTLCSSSYIVKELTIIDGWKIGGSLGLLISKDDRIWPPKKVKIIKSDKLDAATIAFLNKPESIIN